MLILAGRYGDPLNPWGDIITIAQAWCASTPDVSTWIVDMDWFYPEWIDFDTLSAINLSLNLTQMTLLGVSMLTIYNLALHLHLFYTFFRLGLCWVCQRMWRRRTVRPVETPSNSMLIGVAIKQKTNKELPGRQAHKITFSLKEISHGFNGVSLDIQNIWSPAFKNQTMREDARTYKDLCWLNIFRIYGPRLYPYLTTNWKFVWSNPGKRPVLTHFHSLPPLPSFR